MSASRAFVDSAPASESRSVSRRGALIERLLRRVALADPDRARAPVIAPFTGETLAMLPVGEAADVELAVARAWRARACAGVAALSRPGACPAGGGARPGPARGREGAPARARGDPRHD